MKFITPYLIKFAAAAILFTIIFRFCLSNAITNQNVIVIIISAIIYGSLMFASGWFYGEKDGSYLPIYDVGFRFHLTTFIVHISISFLWFIFGFNSKYENIKNVYLVLMVWTPILLFHFFIYVKTRKKSIKGLEKNDLFE